MKLSLLYLCALFLFGFLFLQITFHFWVQMTLSIILLCTLAFWGRPRALVQQLVIPANRLRFVLVMGISSALLLYGLFYIGNYCATSVFDFASSQVKTVYHFKSNYSTPMIIILLATIIGPGEELLWRGFFQETLQKRLGLFGFLLSIAAYTGIHIVSGNLMLIAAAALCGLFWALLYRRFNSLWINIISHTLWDITIFVLFPIT